MAASAVVPKLSVTFNDILAVPAALEATEIVDCVANIVAVAVSANANSSLRYIVRVGPLVVSIFCMVYTPSLDVFSIVIVSPGPKPAAIQSIPAIVSAPEF